jgi:hypothetical protein
LGLGGPTAAADWPGARGVGSVPGSHGSAAGPGPQSPRERAAAPALAQRDDAEPRLDYPRAPGPPGRPRRRRRRSHPQGRLTRLRIGGREWRRPRRVRLQGGPRPLPPSRQREETLGAQKLVSAFRPATPAHPYLPPTAIRVTLLFYFSSYYSPSLLDLRFLPVLTILSIHLTDFQVKCI